MTRNGLLAIACTLSLFGSMSGRLAAQTKTSWTSAEAVAAAKGSPDLTAALSKEIGGTPEEAAGAAGALFGLAKTRLKADEFSQVATAVPGMDLLLKAAPAAPAAAGGAAGALSQMAGSASGIPGVAAAFSKMGLKPELVGKAASTLVSFVTNSGGANVGSLLAGVLK